MPNLRQVHLFAEETLQALRNDGFDVAPGELGENLTTSGLTLESLPRGSQLAIGTSAVIELTGLRTPCVLIDRYKRGLKQKLAAGDQIAQTRAGVLGIVRHSGSVAPGDRISVSLPSWPWARLPLL